MKKYIFMFIGGLVGFLFGLNSGTMIGGSKGIGEGMIEKLGLSFVAEKLTNDFGIFVFLVFLIPIGVYALLGYLIGHFLEKK